MKSRLALLLVLILAGCSSCYEANRRKETILAQAVEKFHEQLNAEQYQQIYAEADADLRSGTTEAEFIAQLRSAHEQLGKTSGKAQVLIDDNVWEGLAEAMEDGDSDDGDTREIISHGNTPASDLIIGTEQFFWVLARDQPKLLSYKFRGVCSKPCAVGFQTR